MSVPASTALSRPFLFLQRNLSLEQVMREVSTDVDAFLAKQLAMPQGGRARLYEAMRYAAVGGGKRLRPLLVRASAELFDVPPHISLRPGVAVECVHVHSLIHDDLPCMDDDDLRRGKPTVHRAYDEATAVLAGDSLLALAFEVLTDEAPDITQAVLAHRLASAAGAAGMAGGQMLDLLADELPMDLTATTQLQRLKTGALISWCLDAGALLGGASENEQRVLLQYAHCIGLAFQIVDDLLDVAGDENTVGKQLHKDADAGRVSFVSLLGADAARSQARQIIEQAETLAGRFSDKGNLLRQIARFILERDR